MLYTLKYILYTLIYLNGLHYRSLHDVGFVFRRIRMERIKEGANILYLTFFQVFYFLH